MRVRPADVEIGCVFYWLFAACLVVGNAQGADWPNYRGPRHDGVSQETDWNDVWPAGGPRTLWKYNVGIGFSSCAVANNRLFTLGNVDGKESLFCLDATSGELLWKHTYDCDLDDRFFEGGPTSTPTVNEEFVYSFSRPGELTCLESSTGVIRWSKDVPRLADIRIPGWGFSSSPLIHADKLVLNAGESGVALNKRTGDLVWKSGDAEAGYMTPLPFSMNGVDYALIASGKFYQCVELNSGIVVWKHRWLTTYGCNAASPIVFGSKAFLSSGYGRGAALLNMRTNSYEVIWQNKEMQNQLNSSVLLDGYLYGFDGDEGGEMTLKCLEFETGKVAWSEGGFGSGSLLAANGKIIVLSQQGELIVAPASSSGFLPTSRTKVLEGKCWTVPVLSNGRIYCRNAAGDLVCMDLHSPKSGNPK
jgi:outer membrane protein assembly factor BamB